MGRKPGNGCITCRIRRVKCDEAKPDCSRCLQAKRVCDGYLSHQAPLSRRQLLEVVRDMSILGPVSRALSPLATSQSSLSPSSSPSPRSGQSSSRDLMLFDLFRQSTAPGTGQFAISTFWSRQLLQLAHYEPAIWHAAVSIGAMHRHFTLESKGDADNSLVEQANLNYGKAMELARDIKSPSVVLALSLALNAAANLLYYFSDTSAHLLAGLRILQELDIRSSETPHLTGVLMRMDMHAMTFSDSQSPYPYAESGALRDAGAGMLHETQDITSYDMAASTLFVLLRRFLMLDQNPTCSVVDYNARYATVQRELLNWEQRMAAFENTNRRFSPRSPRTSNNLPRADMKTAASPVLGGTEDVTIIARLSIRLHHTYLRTILAASLVGDETRWDDYLSHFEHMERLCAALARLLREQDAARVSLEPGLIATMFFLVHRCRHQFLRRRALYALQRLNRQEGNWRSDGAARVVEQIIMIEESEAHTFTHGAGLPPQLVTEDLLSSSTGADGMLEPTDDEVDDLVSVPWQAWSAPKFRPPSKCIWSPESGALTYIPGQARVKAVVVLTEFHKRQIKLTLLMNPTDATKQYGTQRELVVSV